jgi:hypothetical protein
LGGSLTAAHPLDGFDELLWVIGMIERAILAEIAGQSCRLLGWVRQKYLNARALLACQYRKLEPLEPRKLTSVTTMEISSLLSATRASAALVVSTTRYPQSRRYCATVALCSPSFSTRRMVSSWLWALAT